MENRKVEADASTQEVEKGDGGREGPRDDGDVLDASGAGHIPDSEQPAAPRPVYDVAASISSLTKSDLTQRVLVGGVWHPGGRDESFKIVRAACEAWLKEYEPEPTKPPDLCKECGGGKQHKPQCILLARRQR